MDGEMSYVMLTGAVRRQAAHVDGAVLGTRLIEDLLVRRTMAVVVVVAVSSTLAATGGLAGRPVGAECVALTTCDKHK